MISSKYKYSYFFVFKTGVMANKADSESVTKHHNVYSHSGQINLVKY